MKDFDIAKYLREHQLGSYGILNHYVDLKPLKEVEVPYKGADPKLTGMGDGDEFEQAETVSETNGSMENRMYELVNRQHLQQLQKIAQMILKDLTDDGFEAEDVEKFLNLQIKAATVPYAQNPKVTAEVEEMEEEWDPSRDQISKKFIGRLPKSVQAKSSVDKVLAALKTAGISTQDLIAFVDAVKTDPDALAFE